MISSFSLTAQKHQKVIDRNFLVCKKGILYAKTDNKPFSGIIATYHRNGIFQSVSTCRQGKLFGLSVILNKKGKVTNKIYYVRDTADGNILRWINDVMARKMQIMVRTDLLIEKKGMIFKINSNTPFTGFAVTYENDVVKAVTEYLDGQLNGMSCTLSPKGKILNEIYIFNGKKYKTITQWICAVNSQDGKEYVPASYLYPKDELWYRRSDNKLFTGVVVTYHTNGQPKTKITYRNGLADGPGTIYSHEGKIIKKLSFNKEKIPIKKSTIAVEKR
jgi:antitoxin component YwqK of YwqJK toxin-antitoxin module